MDTINITRRSFLLITLVTVVLMLLTLVFHRKVYAMLSTDREEALLDITEQHSLAYEKSLEKALEYMAGVASMVDSEKEDWREVAVALENNPFRFSKIGVVDLSGRGVVGPDVPIGRYPGIRQAFRGYKTISPIEDLPDGSSSFMFASPIIFDTNAKFAIYGIMNQEGLLSLLGGTASEGDSWHFIMDNAYNILLPRSNKGMRDAIEGWLHRPGDYGVEANAQRLRNKVKRYKMGIELFSPGDGDYYVQVVPMGLNDWLFASVSSGSAIRGQINNVIELFLVVFGALLLLFVIVLTATQIADANYRARLFNLAFIDSLTGLPNWEKMKQDMRWHMESDKTGRDLTLATFDIKNFKMINEVYGYQKGDDILSSIGSRLAKRDALYIEACRFENDCFAMLIPGNDVAEITRLLDAFLDDLPKTAGFDNLRLVFAGGACVIPHGVDRDWDGYMNLAKIAREAVACNSHHEVAFYDAELRAKLVRAQLLKGDMAEALDNGDFLMYLQPKYAIALKGHEKLVGGEALVRWRHRTLGMLPPGEFIPIFEEDGSVEKIDRFIFSKACQTLARWKREGRPLYPISVNLSRVQFNNPRLVEELSGLAEYYQAPAKLIDIELTESASFGDMAMLLRTMNQLKERGFRMSLDDFGTGYSSLSLLKEMPMDVLKLDKSFIDPLRHDDRKGLQFIKDIINMADNLGIQSLAEGVETEKQVDLLRAVECSIVQGYFFGKPMPIEEYELLLDLSRNTRCFVPRVNVG